LTLKWEIFQSTLPCGERLYGTIGVDFGGTISIHAPLRGATITVDNKHSPISLFQSTLPCGERPDTGIQPPVSCCIISIHAPLRGATLISGQIAIFANFNPRSPAGSDFFG